jgi:hypothetical protein
MYMLVGRKGGGIILYSKFRGQTQWKMTVTLFFAILDLDVVLKYW